MLDIVRQREFLLDSSQFCYNSIFIVSLSLCSQCVTAVRSGLCVLAVLVDNPETKEKMADWGVSDMLELVTTKFPDFATGSELCNRITTNLPGYEPPPDTKEELTRKK